MFRLLTRYLFLTIFLFSSVLADLNMSGYIKGFMYANPNEMEYSELGSRLQTVFSGSLGSRASYYAGVNYQLNEFSDSGDEHFTLFPLEYYMDMHFDNTDLRIGQQYIFWGTGSWINPTDKINPWNYGKINAEIEDYRIPVWAINTQWYWNQFTFQGILIPGFRPAVIPLPNYTVISPRQTLENTQLAFKLTSYLGQTDFSLSYYKGFDAFPTFNVMMTNAGPSFYYSYQPIYMIGADIVRSFDSMTIKSEVAYNCNDDINGDDISISNSNIHAILGIDYSFTDKLSTNIQYSGVYLLDYDMDDEITAITAAGMSAYLDADELITHSVSGMLMFDIFKYTQGQLLTVVNVQDQDSFLMGFISWEIADAVHLTCGAVLFQGSETSQFGKSSDQDKLFLELKMSF